MQGHTSEAGSTPFPAPRSIGAPRPGALRGPGPLTGSTAPPAHGPGPNPATARLAEGRRAAERDGFLSPSAAALKRIAERDARDAQREAQREADRAAERAAKIRRRANKLAKRMAEEREASTLEAIEARKIELAFEREAIRLAAAEAAAALLPPVDWYVTSTDGSVVRVTARTKAEARRLALESLPEGSTLARGRTYLAPGTIVGGAGDRPEPSEADADDAALEADDADTMTEG